MDALLETQALSRRYGQFQALAPTNLTLQAGDLVTLSGPNGAGKSTLLLCLAGLLPPSTGEIRVNGHDLLLDERQARRDLAFVPDVPRFYNELTAWEHLRFIALAHEVADGFDSRAEALLREFDLWSARHLFPHHFSRGMRLKLGLLLALIRPFRVLLLDEPTSALDQSSVELLASRLVRIRDNGGAVLLSTHDPFLASRLATRQLSMHDGQIEPA